MRFKSFYDIIEARYVFKLYSEFDGPFIIEKIELTPTKSWSSFWTGTRQSKELPTQYFDNIDQRIEGSGIHTFTITTKCNLDSNNHSSANYIITCSGNIICRILASGEIKSFSFSNIEWRSDW